MAGCASGKAGGFLAGGWGGEETEVLHREGFKLHAELSQTLNIESYRKLPTLSVAASEEKTRQGGKRHLPDLPSWLDGNVFRCSSMDKETAQVTPKELTLKLMNAAVEKGAKVVLGEAQVGNAANAANAHLSSFTRMFLELRHLLFHAFFLMKISAGPAGRRAGGRRPHGHGGNGGRRGTQGQQRACCVGSVVSAG